MALNIKNHLHLDLNLSHVTCFVAALYSFDNTQWDVELNPGPKHSVIGTSAVYVHIIL